jgi:hypothetical protein
MLTQQMHRFIADICCRLSLSYLTSFSFLLFFSVSACPAACSVTYGRMQRTVAAFEFDRETLFASGSRTMGLGGSAYTSGTARSVASGMFAGAGNSGGGVAAAGSVTSAALGLSSRFTT